VRNRLERIHRFFAKARRALETDQAENRRHYAERDSGKLSALQLDLVYVDSGLGAGQDNHEQKNQCHSKSLQDEH
jgi:hypothetical protein